ncbi:MULTISPECIES: AmpG family muropeptide MFS transporter [Synechococcaceae]|uniref:AmpG family muropeptide MFS transporter n=1 Tax=Synechococcaceae TaxID=1890426 RepID=UPI00223AF469|nr:MULTISPECIES: MFS transporter [Synechococcaceae]MCT4363456.1 MFS transporter [Candidatus Regnicoccus frigidus MAG-AL1]MCT4367951.1 MFS transporter [Candidatus Regnicoccus frigidus MAG-AL2]
MHPETLPPDSTSGHSGGDARSRLVAVAAQGVASGTPYMVGSRLLQGWLAASNVPLSLIGLLGLAELPYTLKMFWAPLLDRWPLQWPDRRRGWLLVLQLTLVMVIGAMALLRPSSDAASLTLIGVMAVLLAVVSASQDIAVDAYRTDLLPASELGGGAAASSLGYRGAMLAIGAGGFVLAGRFGWPVAFLAAAALMLAVVPFTLAAPRLAPIVHPVTSLRQAVVGPAKEFLRRTGGSRALLILLLVLLYRWPDGLLGLMVVPFLIQEGFAPELIGTVQAGWGIAATMAGTVLGGVLFARLGMNRSLWLFSIAGAIGNLSYWALARFGGGVPGLLVAVSLENLAGGMVGAVFVALLMSLCNPRFSATQYALLSGVYALSRSILAAPAGVVAEQVGWPSFFLFTALAALPAFLLMLRLTPWRGNGVIGAFDPIRDAT